MILLNAQFRCWRFKKPMAIAWWQRTAWQKFANCFWTAWQLWRLSLFVELVSLETALNLGSILPLAIILHHIGLHIMWCVFSSLRWMRLRIISCRGANTPSTLLRRNRCFLFCSYFYCCHLHPFVPTILFTASRALGPHQDWLERQSWTTSGPAHILLKIGELVFQT